MKRARRGTRSTVTHGTSSSHSSLLPSNSESMNLGEANAFNSDLTGMESVSAPDTLMAVSDSESIGGASCHSDCLSPMDLPVGGDYVAGPSDSE